MDYALLNLLVTGGILVATFAFRKRILKVVGRFLFDGAVKFARATYFDEADLDDGHGNKTRVLRPNAQGEAILRLGMNSALAWAKDNVKINLPALGAGLGLPSVDAEQLGGALMGGVAQKVISGKKLKSEDLIQGVLGYFLPRLGGLVNQFTGGKPAAQGVPGGGKAESMSEITKKLIP